MKLQIESKNSKIVGLLALMAHFGGVCRKSLQQICLRRLEGTYGTLMAQPFVTEVLLQTVCLKQLLTLGAILDIP